MVKPIPTVISAGIRDSSGSLHVKNPDTNTWSVDKSAPKQIAPKGEISVPGDKGKAAGKQQKGKTNMASGRNPTVKSLESLAAQLDKRAYGMVAYLDKAGEQNIGTGKRISSDQARMSWQQHDFYKDRANQVRSWIDRIASGNVPRDQMSDIKSGVKEFGRMVAPAAKPTAGLRGTQNEANKAAIIEGRKARAKGPLSALKGVQINAMLYDMALAQSGTRAQKEARIAKAVEGSSMRASFNKDTVDFYSRDVGEAKKRMTEVKAVRMAAAANPEPAWSLSMSAKPPRSFTDRDPLKLIDKRNETARSLAEQTRATGVDAGRGAAARDLVARNEKAIGKAAKPSKKAPKPAKRVSKAAAAIKEAQATPFTKGLNPEQRANILSGVMHSRAYAGTMPVPRASALKQRAFSAASQAMPGLANNPEAHLAALAQAPVPGSPAAIRGGDKVSKLLNNPNLKPKAVAKPAAAKPGTKALGLLAPVALGTAMLAGANEAKAEGLGTAGQIKEAGKEGGKAAVTMGAFTVGTVGAVKGLMKLGMTAGRALPLVNAGMMVGGAIHGAVTAKPGERLVSAARGAWDMSLPGMVVNTGLAAKEAVQGRVGTSPSTGGHDMGASFAAANQRYQAMREAAATAEPADKRKGWSNAARIAAAKARGASNLPYGGDAAAGPSQYAPK